jgi:hypothetical protein
MNGKNIIWVLVLVLVLQTASADFSLETDLSEQSVCQGDTVLFTTTVTGSGSVTVTQEGSAASYSTSVPLNLNLASQNVVYTYVTPASSTLPSLYELNVVASDQTNVKKSNLKVNVQDCHALQISGDLNKDLCECESQRIIFTVKNNGKFKETYGLSLSGNGEDMARLADSTITLEANEEKEVNVNVDVLCNVKGNYDLTLSAESANSDASSAFTTNLNVESCFGFNADLAKTFVNMCEKDSENVELSVKNVGAFDNIFEVEVNGPQWMNVDKSELTIAKDEEETVNLVLEPMSVIGNFTSTIRISTRDNKVIQEADFKVNVRSCYGIEAEIDDSIKVCNAFETSKGIEIANLGEFDNTFVVESSVDWIEAFDIEVAAGESESLLLNINAETIEAGNYDVLLTIMQKDAEDVRFEKNINVEVVDKADCYKVEVEYDNNLNVKRDGSKLVAITLNNIGLEDGNYIVEVTGDTSFVQVNPTSLSVAKGKSATTYAYIAPPKSSLEGVYEANIRIKLDDNTLLDDSILKMSIGDVDEVVDEVVVKENNRTSVLDRLRAYFSNRNEITGNVVLSDEELIVTENTTFSLDEGEHSLIIKEIGEDYVVIELRSEPVELTLNLNESAFVDLDQDGEDDLVVTLLNMDPEISVAKIPKEVSAGSNRNLIIGGVILAIIILFILFYYLWSSEDEEEDEDEKEDVFDEDFDVEEESEGGYKLGRWILGIVVVIIAYIYLKDYLQLDILIDYKNYVITGLVVLIVLLAIVKYWDRINKFLDELDEEEPEEEKVVKKKISKKKTAKKKVVKKKAVEETIPDDEGEDEISL